MKYLRSHSVITILVAMILLIALVVAAQVPYSSDENRLATLKNGVNGQFSCFTYDDQGHILQGFRSEQDGNWYLCVTSVQDVADVRLYWTGNVTAASAGQLHVKEAAITGGFEKSGDSLVLTQEDGTEQKVVLLQSDLPSVYVDLAKITLDDIHADKSIKHKNNSLYIQDPENDWNLSVVGSVEIKGRGNSSWREYEKKGYQIEFDRKTPVLGMAEAKKWVLLSNASDDSLMRTQLVSRMAKRMDMEFVASFEYVDLWIDGEYLGTYLMGEKVELDESRLNLLDAAGALFEHDEDFYLEEEHWLMSNVLNRHFSLKAIVTEKNSVIRSAMTDFQAAVDGLTQYLYGTPSEQVTLEELPRMIDVDSFVKYFLINEYTLNRESFSTSFYWYQDGPEDVLHLGPVWDFDTCMGNDKEPPTSSYGENHVIFRYLLAAPAFYERTMALLDEYRDELESMTDDVDVLRTQIAQSAEMNYLRWNVLGKPNPKGGMDYEPTFDAAADALQQWLAGRENAFQVVRSKIATSVVSEDCRTMTVFFQPEKDYESIIVALWSEENGNDDLNWYRADKREDGSWQCLVDLENHNCSGIYYYNVYTDNQQELLATGRNYVPTAQAPRYDLQVEIAADTAELVLQLNDATGTLTAVRLDIWGSTVQNTSFHRLQAEQNAQGIWVARAPMCAFNLPETDDLIIQAYGVDQAMELKLNERLLSVGELYAHSYSESGNCTVCGDRNGVEEFLAKAPVYCLRNPNTDERFYTGSVIELDALIAAGWQDDGVAWYASIFGNEPVYRLLNPNTFGRFYTMDREEVTALEEAGWVYEGVGWSSHSGGEPVYRMYNPHLTSGSHRYTASEAERDALMELGWIYEGICWYGAPDF